jgi:IS6 family transposase
MRPHLNRSGTSYRLDEPYVKVGTGWKYLYRAVDSAGDTIEFLLSAKRDVSAAKRFFRKLMRANHRRLPSIHQKEVAGDAMFSLLPHGRANTRRS